jgi:hypothetical protein
MNETTERLCQLARENERLTLRLAEAEQLLIAVFDHGLRPERLKRIEAFLDGSADSAFVAPAKPKHWAAACYHEFVVESLPEWRVCRKCRFTVPAAEEMKWMQEAQEWRDSNAVTVNEVKP